MKSGSNAIANRALPWFGLILCVTLIMILKLPKKKKPECRRRHRKPLLSLVGFTFEFEQ
jgi:hypothetical protein